MSNCYRSFVLALLTAMACDPSVAQLKKEILVVRAFLNYDLQITQVAQTNLVENDWIDVSFVLTVTQGGIGNAQPKDGAVCGANRTGTCIPVTGMAPGRTYRSTVHTTAPRAAAQAPVSLILISNLPCAPGVECFGEELLQEANVAKPVA